MPETGGASSPVFKTPVTPTLCPTSGTPDTNITTSPPLLLSLSHDTPSSTLLHQASTGSVFISTIRVRPVFTTTSQWPREAVVMTAGRFSFIHLYPSILPATSCSSAPFPVSQYSFLAHHEVPQAPSHPFGHGLLPPLPLGLFRLLQQISYSQRVSCRCI